MDEATPVLDTILAMTAASLENSALESRELMLVRIAALAAVGAAPVSYLANVGPATDVGVTIEDVQDVLSAVAPIIGSPLTVLAARNVMRALGFAIAVIEAEIDAELAELEDEE